MTCFLYPRKKEAKNMPDNQIRHKTKDSDSEHELFAQPGNELARSLQQLNLVYRIQLTDWMSKENSFINSGSGGQYALDK